MITIQCTKVHASGAAPVAPDMIEFDMPQEFRKKVEKCLDFMRTNTVREMMIEHAFSYRLYKDVKNLPEGDFGGTHFVTANDATYAPFDSPVRVTGCNAHLYVTGQIWVTLPVDVDGGAFDCELTLPAA